MEKLSLENKEKNEKGYDIEVHVLFSRHAEKDSHGGDITLQGQKDAQQLGKTLKRLESMKDYEIEPSSHSGHKRTAGTAFLINNPDLPLQDFSSIDIESKRDTGKILESSIDRYSEEADKKYSELAAGNYASEGTAVEYFAKLNDKKYDKDTLSSVEMSKLVAKDLLDIVDSTKELPAHSKKSITNIVHSGIFEHFIIDLLTKRGEEKPIESIGGSLGFLGNDDLRVYIRRETPEKVSIGFRFRDRNKNGTMRYYRISEEELKEISFKNQEKEDFFEINLRDQLANKIGFNYIGSFDENNLAIAVTGQGNEQKYILNKNGKIIAGPYDHIQPFKEGLARVKREKEYYFIDINGKEVIGPLKGFIRDFENGTSEISEGNIFYYINKKGEKIEKKYTPKNISTNKEDVKEYSQKYIDGAYYLINKNGDKIFGPIESFHGFSEGLGLVTVSRSGKNYGESYFIDENGKKILGPYNGYHPSGFKEGVAVVSDDDGSSDKYYYIDHGGKRIFKNKYLSIKNEGEIANEEDI